MHYSSKLGIAIACCPSVTLVDCDHIGWKSWKLIAQTIIPTPSLFIAIHLQPGLGLGLWLGLGISSSSLAFTYLLMGNSGEAEWKQTGDVYNIDKIVNNVEVLAQSWTDFALTYNFQGTRILGASHSHLCDSSVFLLTFIRGVLCMLYTTKQQTEPGRPCTRRLNAMVTITIGRKCPVLWQHYRAAGSWFSWLNVWYYGNWV